MAKRIRYAPLNVFVNERQVGQLNRESTGAIRFQYDAEWLVWEHASPVSISLPLREDQFVGEQVIAVFDNLLPDYGPIRTRVAERVGAKGTDAFSLLSEIGRDCVGALQFLAEDEEPQTSRDLTGRELNDQAIGKLLDELDIAPLGIRRENDFRISVAGAQEKTALLLRDGQWIEPAGTTPTTHIIKPQIGRLANGMDLSDSVENEHLCLQLLRAFGLRTASTEVLTFNDRKALVIERFDRKWVDAEQLIRLPQEDCCQALSIPSTQKYQNEGGPGIKSIFDVLQGSDEPLKDRHDFFKTQVLFWLMGATDGHAKNFSIALSTQGRFRMTPLYDVLTIQPSLDAGHLTHKEYKLAMSFGKSNQYNVELIQRRHLVDTGLACGLSRELIADVLEGIVGTAEAAFQKTVEQLPDDFPQGLVESLMTAFMRRLKRLRE